MVEVTSYTPLGYQADPRPSLAPETLSRRIDAAVAAVPADKRGSLILRADRARASVDLAVRLATNIVAIARVSKPWTGPAEAEAMLRVNFAAAVKHGGLLGFGDYYRMLRDRRDGVRRNSRFRALVKALALQHLRAQPYLDGGEWFDRG